MLGSDHSTSATHVYVYTCIFTSLITHTSTCTVSHCTCIHVHVNINVNMFVCLGLVVSLFWVTGWLGYLSMQFLPP